METTANTYICIFVLYLHSENNLLQGAARRLHYICMYIYSISVYIDTYIYMLYTLTCL